MKQKFSLKWKASKQPRKQRKYRARAPLHLKYKMLAAHLSKDLIKKYKKRSMPLRKGDNIKVARGTFKGKQGRISTVNTKKTIVYIEGIQKTRKDGTKVNMPFHPSNLIITELNLEDKKRIKKLNKNIKEDKKGN